VRIVDIRETVVPIKSEIRNAYIDFSQMTVSVLALVTDIVPDAPAKSPVPPNSPAVQAQPRGCAEWTDRCVTCQRDAGKITCSNIGAACQPQAVECMRAEPAEEKKRGN